MQAGSTGRAGRPGRRWPAWARARRCSEAARTRRAGCRPACAAARPAVRAALEQQRQLGGARTRRPGGSSSRRARRAACSASASGAPAPVEARLVVSLIVAGVELGLTRAVGPALRTVRLLWRVWHRRLAMHRSFKSGKIAAETAGRGCTAGAPRRPHIMPAPGPAPVAPAPAHAHAPARGAACAGHTIHSGRAAVVGRARTARVRAPLAAPRRRPPPHPRRAHRATAESDSTRLPLMRLADAPAGGIRGIPTP